MPGQSVCVEAILYLLAKSVMIRRIRVIRVPLLEDATTVNPPSANLSKKGADTIGYLASHPYYQTQRGAVAPPSPDPVP